MLFIANSSVKWGHVQRIIDEENGRLAMALMGVRLATAKAVRWRNIVLMDAEIEVVRWTGRKGRLGSSDEVR